jgi:predicted transcriptional regulator
MLVRELMSSPVVTVAPGAQLKEVADLLVRHEISAVPVVERDQLVGIVSEADLVPLELGADPRAHLAPVREPPARRLATLLVRGVPGVVDLRFAEE